LVNPWVSTAHSLSAARLWTAIGIVAVLIWSSWSILLPPELARQGHFSTPTGAFAR
jgi:hypothetical protein